MARILGVGIATVDIILGVQSYPVEDSENRALWQKISRGGNCCNTLVVLSQLGHECHWAGTCLHPEQHPLSQVILSDLERYQVHDAYCFWPEQGCIPTSYIYLNVNNGSRSIVHYRDLPEYPAERFHKIPLSDWDWFHFEARNIGELRKMLVTCQKYDAPISLEVEKHRPDLESVLNMADVILFSKDYARSLGMQNPADLLNHMSRQYPGINMICTWGDQGAWCCDKFNKLNHCTVDPIQAVDTLGAGDTFNAGIIHKLLLGEDLTSATQWACELAAKKCRQHGLHLGERCH